MCHCEHKSIGRDNALQYVMIMVRTINFEFPTYSHQ